MKPEQQRIKIAEACGLKWWRMESVSKIDGKDDYDVWFIISPKNPHRTALNVDFPLSGYDWDLSDLPGYLNSLDAMAEAEKLLTERHKLTYIQELQSIICGKSSPSYDWVNSLLPSSKLCVFATAAQRAEAFLRTLNLWLE